jgi:hypothetical protein
MQGYPPLIGIDDVELHLGEDLLHGFEIQSGPGDVRDLLILLLQRQETAGLADRFGDPTEE